MKNLISAAFFLPSILLAADGDVVAYKTTGTNQQQQVISTITGTGTFEVSASIVASGTQVLTGTSSMYQIYTGATGTQSLPTVSVRGANPLFYKNAGSGTLTILAGSGNNIYDTSSVSSVNIAPGEARIFVPSGTTFYVQ